MAKADQDPKLKREAKIAGAVWPAGTKVRNIIVHGSKLKPPRRRPLTPDEIEGLRRGGAL